MSDIYVEALKTPKENTPPLLKGISGRANTTQPLTEKSYAILRGKLLKNKTAKSGNLIDNFSTFIDRAIIPRTIALKMTDLTESYSNQMWELIEEACSIEKDDDEPYGPELEGRLDKGQAIAERFQEAHDSINECFKYLKEECSKVCIKVFDEINIMKIEPQEKCRSVENLCKRSGIKLEWLSNIQGDYQFNFEPTLLLLPLIKGKSVYTNRSRTLEYLIKYATNKNNSLQRSDKTTTAKNTTIEILHQVEPKYEHRVFSDHAGFIATFSHPFSVPLYVYYHSLENGYQHTNTRIAWNYGAQSSLSIPLSSSNPDSDSRQMFNLHNPREAYIPNLHEKLRYLFGNNNSPGDVLVIVGECTSEIHNSILDLVLKVEQNQFNKKIVRINENTMNIYGAPTLAPGYDLKFINASKKSRDKKGKIINGLGVHALTAYMFYNTKLGPRKIPSLEPKLLTLASNSTTEQNILSLSYGPSNELHAFTHLLNGNENALATELKNCGYCSVGGDLNNISMGDELVQTVDISGTFLRMGSNSVGTSMYDKIVILQ